MRVCDGDRDRAIAELRDRFSDGSLAQDSFIVRVDAVLRARRRDELAAVLADLPAPRMPLAQAALRRLSLAAQAAASWPARRGRRQATRPELVLPSGRQDTFTIGRDAACDLVLCDITVSRHHADLRRGDGGWLLSDAGSTNGTRINGWRVTAPVPLRAGDQVTFGALSLMISDHAWRAAAASTP